MAKQFTLGKNERLKSRKEIEQLFNGGKSFVITPFRTFFLFSKPAIQNSLIPIQFGAGVSTKNFKKAVERNRIKRLLRETWRLQKATLQKKINEKNMKLNVFIVYSGKEVPGYNEVYNKVNLILDKLNTMIDEIK